MKPTLTFRCSLSIVYLPIVVGATGLFLPLSVPPRVEAQPRSAGPSARAAARLKYHPPKTWIRHYLSDDRYKIAGGIWKFVSTDLDGYFHRPYCQGMLRQSADSVIGFASVGDATEAGYRADPACASDAAIQQYSQYVAMQQSAGPQRSDQQNQPNGEFKQVRTPQMAEEERRYNAAYQQYWIRLKAWAEEQDDSVRRWKGLERGMYNGAARGIKPSNGQKQAVNEAYEDHLTVLRSRPREPQPPQWLAEEKRRNAPSVHKIMESYRPQRAPSKR